LTAVLAEITAGYDRWLRKSGTSLRDIRANGLKELAAAVIAQALDDLAVPIPADLKVPIDKPITDGLPEDDAKKLLAAWKNKENSRRQRLADLSELRESAEAWIFGNDCELWCELADVSVERFRDKAAELLDAEYASQRRPA